MKNKSVKTTWEVWSYDVWGNAKDGWDVNDKSCIDREYVIAIPITINNAGTPSEFESASPTDKQIRQALGLKRIQLDTDGDDLTIYVNHASTGYPCGEMHCTSHESLSPIRSKLVAK